LTSRSAFFSGLIDPTCALSTELRNTAITGRHLRAFCFLLVVSSCVSVAKADDPDVSVTSPLTGTKITSNGTTSVTATAKKFLPYTSIIIFVTVTNTTTGKSVVSTFNGTTTGTGAYDFSGSATNPAGSTGDKATIEVEVEETANTGLSASATVSGITFN
jgi:hypothetical protein